MKFKKEEHQLITNRKDSKSLVFGIGDPSVIIDILRKRLYSYPLRTMIQEYLCNARDASREAGSEGKIEITLPTKLDSVFKVRDFGLGLSPERVEEVFVKYGSSTKRTDNSQTGGFGIGAKSAWAYTDSFTVVSVNAGVKRTYVAHLGTNTEGSLDLLDEEDSTEENGVEISVSIKEEDINSAVDAIFRAVYFWDTPPVFKGVLEVEIPPFYKQLPAFKGTSFFVDNNEISFLDSGNKKPRNQMFIYEQFKSVDFKCYAVIDGIPYDISKIVTNKYFAYNTQIYLLFNTGDLEINANREEIVYDENSINLISERVELVFSEVKDFVKNHFSDCQDLNDLKNRVSTQDGVLKSLSVDYEFNIKVLDKDVSVKKQEDRYFFFVSGCRIMTYDLNSRVRYWGFNQLKKMLVIDQEWEPHWPDFLRMCRSREILTFLPDMFLIHSPVELIFRTNLGSPDQQNLLRETFYAFLKMKEAEAKLREEERLKMVEARAYKKELATKWGVELAIDVSGQHIRTQSFKIDEIPEKENWVYLVLESGSPTVLDIQNPLAKRVLFLNKRLKKRILLTDPARLDEVKKLDLAEMNSFFEKKMTLGEEEKTFLYNCLLTKKTHPIINEFSLDFIEKLADCSLENEYKILKNLKLNSINPPSVSYSNLVIYSYFFKDDYDDLEKRIKEQIVDMELFFERNYFFRVINYRARNWEKEAIRMATDLLSKKKESKT